MAYEGCDVRSDEVRGFAFSIYDFELQLLLDHPRMVSLDCRRQVVAVRRSSVTQYEASVLESWAFCMLVLQRHTPD